MLAKDATAKDFVADAFAHCKFIGHTADANNLFDAAGVKDRDDGFVPLAKSKDAKTFVTQCRELRFWARELEVDLDAASLKA
jgi:catalase